MKSCLEPKPQGKLVLRAQKLHLLLHKFDDLIRSHRAMQLLSVNKLSLFDNPVEALLQCAAHRIT
jgi:hypothetical protein